MVWYSQLLKNFPQFVVIYMIKGFGVVNKAEVDFFWNSLVFFSDPMDVGNLISDSSAFSKSGLNIWKFMVHILLRPGTCDTKTPNIYAAVKARLISSPGQLLFISIFSNIF